jgi:hypothetical protein
MPTPVWPHLEGDPMIFEDLPGCIGCAIGPPLIGRSRVSEASAILPSAKLFDVHRFPFQGNREETRDFLTGNQRS